MVYHIIHSLRYHVAKQPQARRFPCVRVCGVPPPLLVLVEIGLEIGLEFGLEKSSQAEIVLCGVLFYLVRDIRLL